MNIYEYISTGLHFGNKDTYILDALEVKAKTYQNLISKWTIPLSVVDLTHVTFVHKSNILTQTETGFYKTFYSALNLKI